MELSDPCVKSVLLSISKGLKTKNSVSFNDVIGSPECRRYSVADIGKALELLRRRGLVTAASRFGCSELLEFNATALTDKGRQFLK